MWIYHRLTWVVPEKGPLNECVCVWIYHTCKHSSHSRKLPLEITLRTLWFHNYPLITLCTRFQQLVLQFPVMFLWSHIFMNWHLVLHFQVLHFQSTIITLQIKWQANSPTTRYDTDQTFIQTIMLCAAGWCSSRILSCAPPVMPSNASDITCNR